MFGEGAKLKKYQFGLAGEASRRNVIAEPASSALSEKACVRSIRHGEDFREIAAFWRSLDGNRSTPMQQFIWSDTCWRTLPVDGELQLVVVKTGPRSGAVAPLVRVPGSLHRLEHLGVKYLNEPADFSYSDHDALKGLTRAIAELESPVFLQRVPADSPTVQAIQEAYRARGTVLLRRAAPFPRIVLSDAWREPECQLNSGRRSDLRRAIRRAERIGPVRYEILSPTPEELSSLLGDALEIEAANWKGRNGSAIRNDNLRGGFYRRYAATASQAGTLRLCFMRVGDRAIAVQMAIQCGRAFWLLKIGYREEFSKCSPGMLLTAETIRYAASQGLSSYEFLGGAEDWTRVWTKDERASLAVRAYPFSVRGLSALTIDTSGAIGRRLEQVVRGARR